MIAEHEGGQMAFATAADEEEGQGDSPPAPVPTSTRFKCNRECCTVGRNQAKRSSWFRQKIHFVDVAKLRQPKFCMKTRLVGDDCKPLLIQSCDDITVPLVSPEYSGQHTTKEQQKNKRYTRYHCGKCGLLLDALARTFCLPLLG
jgi:hypothetical protein